MSDPLVCAVLLTCDRPEMTRRAIACFRAQTYANKWLLVLDSSSQPTFGHFEYSEIYVRTAGARTIGALRNKAAKLVAKADILVHFDSDDWAHPRRIEEQVALLLASGKACVGYRELLFWDTRRRAHKCEVDEREGDCPVCVDEDQRQHEQRGEAWLYHNPDPRWVAGASMCYWRSAWELCPFDDAPHEDQRWWLKNSEKCGGVSGFGEFDGMEAASMNPRLICQIHADSTENIPRQVMESGGGGTWRRAPEFDSYCARPMEIKCV
jgi:glycosyltransferase involved in cell wall biosynthesis